MLGKCMELGLLLARVKFVWFLCCLLCALLRVSKCSCLRRGMSAFSTVVRMSVNVGSTQSRSACRFVIFRTEVQGQLLSCWVIFVQFTVFVSCVKPCLRIRASFLALAQGGI